MTEKDIDIQEEETLNEETANEAVEETAVENEAAETETKAEAEEEARTLTVPDLSGLSMTEAATLLSGSGFTFRFEGQSGSVTGQTPAPGTVVKRGGATVTLRLGDGEPKTVTVPDVVKKDLGDAGTLLTRAGLNIGFCRGDNWLGGDRTVTAQSPAAGQVVPVGTVVTLHFPYDESEE